MPSPEEKKILQRASLSELVFNRHCMLVCRLRLAALPRSRGMHETMHGS